MAICRYLLIFVAIYWYLLLEVDICSGLLIQLLLSDICWSLLVFVAICLHVFYLSFDLLLFVDICMFWYLLLFVNVCWHLGCRRLSTPISLNLDPALLISIDICWPLLVFAYQVTQKNWEIPSSIKKYEAISRNTKKY